MLRQLSISELIAKCKHAAELFATAELPMGDARQTVDQLVHQQSASTGLPEHMRPIQHGEELVCVVAY